MNPICFARDHTLSLTAISAKAEVYAIGPCLTPQLLSLFSNWLSRSSPDNRSCSIQYPRAFALTWLYSRNPNQLAIQNT